MGVLTLAGMPARAGLGRVDEHEVEQVLDPGRGEPTGDQAAGRRRAAVFRMSASARTAALPAGKVAGVLRVPLEPYLWNIVGCPGSDGSRRAVVRRKVN